MPRATGRKRCPCCDQRIDHTGFAYASHIKGHVRKGEWKWGCNHCKKDISGRSPRDVIVYMGLPHCSLFCVHCAEGR